MCDNSNDFKLCACDLEGEKADKDKPYWILSRKVPRKKDQFGRHVVGGCTVDWVQDSGCRDQYLGIYIPGMG